MTIDDFLDKFVEGYLFHDLESMAKITLPTGQNDGAVGYPMIATVMAGIELLGNLLMPNTTSFNHARGNDYFLNYWNNYLSNYKPIYSNLGSLFRKLIRHSLAHTFVAKPGILVIKGGSQQIYLDTTRQELYVDCNVLFNDFKDSYFNLIKPIMNGTTSNPLTTNTTMQARLDDMSNQYSNEATSVFGSLTGINPSLTINQNLFTSRASGASLSLPQNIPLSGVVASAVTYTGRITNVVPPSVTTPFTTPSGMLLTKPKNK